MMWEMKVLLLCASPFARGTHLPAELEGQQPVLGQTHPKTPLLVIAVGQESKSHCQLAH